MNYKKRNLLLTLLVAAFAVCVSCGAKQGPVTINGVADGKMKEMVLFGVKDGELVEMAKTAVDTTTGKFSFTFTAPYSGYYVIGWDSPLAPAFKYEFYFEQGRQDQLDVKLGKTGYELLGENNSKENKLLMEWFTYSLKVRQNALGEVYPRMTYVEFFPLITDFSKGAATWLDGKKTGNKTFDALMQQTVKNKTLQWALNFMSLPNNVFPKQNDYVGTYYETIDVPAFTTDTSLLSMPFGFRIMRTAIPIQQSVKTGQMMQPLDEMLAQIIHPRLKELFMIKRILSMRSVEEIDGTMAKYGSLITSPDYLQQIEERKSKLQANRNMMEAANFTFVDIKGKNVSFSDFKGKVILIDIWATWCAPCRAQIPHLIELEKQYHGNKDIVFIAISSDKATDKAKWEKMVKEKNLPGIQLFAGGPDKIPTAYNLQGIPRFILFGKDGKVVESEAPYPSTGLLQPIIDKLLAQ